MTDVRLTATNPEDSSVVPVACNTRGELLIEDVKIENIENDVTIDGRLLVTATDTGGHAMNWDFNNTSATLKLTDTSDGEDVHTFGPTGRVIHLKSDDGARDSIELCGGNFPLFIRKEDGSIPWKMDWSGNVTGPSLKLMLEADKTEHYSSVKDAETGGETTEYIGPVVDVGEELILLRAQVRALMERLKMEPEGG